MDGENRTPDKTIGEVKFAQRRAANTKQEGMAEDKHSQNRAAKSATLAKDQARDGDNRTPDKTIGEVKYAQAHSADQK